MFHNYMQNAVVWGYDTCTFSIVNSYMSWWWPGAIYMHICIHVWSTYAFNSEKLKTDVSSSSCSSMRSLACAWSPFSSLLKPPMRLRACCLRQPCCRQLLPSNFSLSVENVWPKLERSWEMMSPLAWIRGPIRCLPSATRFFRLDHLLVRKNR